MCGIAVAIGWKNAELVVQHLVEGIRHRGDVSDPVFRPHSDTAMATRRLRIVDRENAVQPQMSHDGRVAVSFNGEIYNHEALRAELKKGGIVFRTESDTEVLANALRVWGADALGRLNGMFAFVAVDTKTGEFVAGRDPFGVKPLYVIQQGKSFLFCSEIRPLLSATPNGDVLLLPPAHILTSSTCLRYRTLPNPGYDGLVQGSPGKLDELLSEAVRLRLPPDLPFATLLSGGIDSTLIAHYARRHRPEAPAYFLGGTDAPDYRYVAEFADRSGIDLRHVSMPGGTRELLSHIDEVVDNTETFEPSVIRPAVCSHVISRRIADDGIRVALCGEGADELFAGYQPLEILFADGNKSGRPGREEFLSIMNRTILQRVDRCSMRFGLEVREPFLDQSVADYALNLDATALVAGSGSVPVGKMPLRALYDLYPDELPRSIRDRLKVSMDEGVGVDLRRKESEWIAYFDRAISDSDLADGALEFADYGIRYKEELYCVRRLAQTMDISRIPHLKGRDTMRAFTPEQAAKLSIQYIA